MQLHKPKHQRRAVDLSTDLRNFTEAEQTVYLYIHTEKQRTQPKSIFELLKNIQLSSVQRDICNLQFTKAS